MSTWMEQFPKERTTEETPEAYLERLLRKASADKSAPALTKGAAPVDHSAEVKRLESALSFVKETDGGFAALSSSLAAAV